MNVENLINEYHSLGLSIEDLEDSRDDILRTVESCMIDRLSILYPDRNNRHGTPDELYQHKYRIIITYSNSYDDNLPNITMLITDLEMPIEEYSEKVRLENEEEDRRKLEKKTEQQQKDKEAERKLYEKLKGKYA